MVELWGLDCEDFGENWPRNSGTTLYIFAGTMLAQSYTKPSIYFAPFQIGGILSHPVRNQPDGTIDLADIKDAIRPTNDIHQPLTRVICIENTQNYCGGKIIPLDYIKQVMYPLDVSCSVFSR